MTSKNMQRSGGALLFAAIAAVVIAVMSAAFAISFTALIYKGALAPYLGYGIFLSLISVVTLGGIGALSFSFRGTICGPQDVTSILLGSAGASMALGLGGTSDSLFHIGHCVSHRSPGLAERRSCPWGHGMRSGAFLGLGVA